MGFAALDVARDLHAVPAISAATVAGGEAIATCTHGEADISTGLAASSGHRSRWYSISKPLNALLVFRSALDGRLDLDHLATAQVPGLRFASEPSNQNATLRDCLLHRTGLPAGNWVWDGGPSDPAILIERIPHLPCPLPVGEGFHYQNLNSLILERALDAAGISWHESITSLLAPLEIRPVSRTSDFLNGPRLAAHGPNGLEPAIRIPDVETDGIVAGAGLCGTIAELACVAGMMAGRGVWQGKEIVSPKIWEMATAPLDPLPDSPDIERRAVWRSAAGTWCDYRGHPMLTWTGGHRGHASCASAIPSLGIAACALANRSASSAPEALCLTLIDQVAGWEPTDWPGRFANRKKLRIGEDAKRLETALRRSRTGSPLPPESLAGTFSQPGYGPLSIRLESGALRLNFRSVDLPLRFTSDGTAKAAGLFDGALVLWTLRPVTHGTRVEAWEFNPDQAHYPVRFERATPGSPGTC